MRRLPNDARAHPLRTRRHHHLAHSKARRSVMGRLALKPRGQGMSSDTFFDRLAKSMSSAVNRRQALRGLGATLGGAVLTMVSARIARADPRTCVVCQCGTGRPCNVKLTQCQETRGFSAEVTCQDFCAHTGQDLCGVGSPFHCPHGCAA